MFRWENPESSSLCKMQAGNRRAKCQLLSAYCGPEASWRGVVAGAGPTGGAGLVFIRAPGSALCDTGVNDTARGGNDPVVIALSGFSRWSWLGPSPRLISARASGTVFDCQPWSA